MQDLSEFYHELTDIFLPAGDSALSSAHANFFRENGYISEIKMLDGRQIEALRSAIDLLMDPDQAANPLFYEYHLNESDEPGRTLFHALGAWRVSEVFHDLIFHPQIVRLAEQLLGGPVRFWHDQLFVKPANDGGIVAWHQDYSYWTRTKPMAHLTCWIALDDANEENGCVHYVPGSHKWDLLPRNDLANNMTAVLELLNDEQRQNFNPVPNVLNAGEASFHHPLMLHGSYPNTSSRPRRAAVLNFILDGVCSDSDEPLLAGVPPIPRGKPITGRFFPLLSRTE